MKSATEVHFVLHVQTENSWSIDAAGSHPRPIAFKRSLFTTGELAGIWPKFVPKFFSKFVAARKEPEEPNVCADDVGSAAK